MFGDFVRERRLRQDLTLREFCRRIDEDPSNWSKVERGIQMPPRSAGKLEAVARTLRMKKGSDEYTSLMDQAAVSAGRVPEHAMSDKSIVDSLPAFLRTIGSVKPTKAEIEKLIRRLKEER